MIRPEWIATIVGALLCLSISWFLAVVSYSQRVQFGKVGPAIGIVGALVLAGMAVVGPLHVFEPKGTVLMSDYTEEGYPNFLEGVRRHAKLLSVASRTTVEVGRRPSKNHIAYEESNGQFKWITKDEYRKIKKEQLAKKAK